MLATQGPRLLLYRPHATPDANGISEVPRELSAEIKSCVALGSWNLSPTVAPKRYDDAGQKLDRAEPKQTGERKELRSDR